MRGEGPDSLARDQEGEVDRALGRPAGGGTAEQPAHAVRAPDTRTVGLSEIRFALEEAISQGRAIVVLEVRRPGEGAVRARVPQMVWAALADALAPAAGDEVGGA